MKATMQVSSLNSAVVVIVILAVGGLIHNMRGMTNILKPDGNQQVKEKPAQDADWTLEIAGNNATAFRFEKDHGDNDDTSLSVPAQSPQVEVAGIKKLEYFSFWGHNGFCKVVKNVTVPDANMSSQLRLPTDQPPSLPVVVNFTFGCKELFQSSVLGTGNWISSF